MSEGTGFQDFCAILLKFLLHGGIFRCSVKIGRNFIAGVARGSTDFGKRLADWRHGFSAYRAQSRKSLGIDERDEQQKQSQDRSQNAQ